MLSFEQFVEKTIKLETEQELFTLYEEFVADYGFDRVVYTLLTDHPSIRKPARHGVLGNYPDDWMDHYMVQDYEKIDPVIQTASLSKSPFAWSEIMKMGEWSDAQRRFMSEGAEAGLKNGAAIPIFGGLGEVAGVGLASSVGNIDTSAKTLQMLRAITTQFHFRYCELEREKLALSASHLTLSPREKEILHWTADGKSDAVIGSILGISQDAIKYHRKNIYRKLEVSERTMSVLKAMRLGLINPYSLR